MNVDAEESADNWQNFRLIEATGVKGVSYSTFMEVFDVDSVALMRPRDFTATEWTAALTALKDDLGKPYDSLFDLLDDKEMSCVELVRNALMRADDNYHDNFANLDTMISRYDDLVPQMFRDDDESDFVIELEIDRAS
jgi:hypothetical protein